MPKSKVWKWKSEDVEYLKQNYAEKTYEEISVTLNIPLNYIISKARLLKLVKLKPLLINVGDKNKNIEVIGYSTKSKDGYEREVLVCLCTGNCKVDNGVGTEFLVFKSDFKKTSSCGCSRMASWTAEEISFLRNNYEKLSGTELLKTIKKTEGELRWKMSSLNLRRIRFYETVKPGDIFGKRTVIEVFSKKCPDGVMRTHCKFRCECTQDTFKEGEASIWDLRRSESCGCDTAERISEKNTKHGYYNRKYYHRWFQMMSRCYDETDPSYVNYGQRGIYVDEELWNYPTYETMLDDIGCDENLTVDRINNDGPYSIENCRAATRAQQNVNRRNTRYLTALGETKLLIEWLKDPRCVVSRGTLYKRVGEGWNDEEAITIADKRDL